MSAGRLRAVVRCYAGEQALALAAGVVVGIDAPREGVPHLGSWLSGRGEPQWRQARLLRVSIDGHACQWIVDGPVKIARISHENIVPLAPGIPMALLEPVMGFAAIEDELVALLDVRKLARMTGELRSAAR